MPNHEIKITVTLENSAGEVLSRGEYARILGHKETIGDLLELWRIACERADIHGGAATMQIRLGQRSLFLLSPPHAKGQEITRMARVLHFLTGG
jgi:hypothetical protein